MDIRKIDNPEEKLIEIIVRGKILREIENPFRSMTEKEKTELRRAYIRGRKLAKAGKIFSK